MTNYDVYKKYNAFKPESKKKKKYPCPDCFNCLFCGEARCKVCLKSQCQKPKKQQND